MRSFFWGVIISFTNARDVGKYILHKCFETTGERPSNTKLQMLLYYSQAFHLAVYELPLFEDRLVADPHGPVVPDIFLKYERYGAEPIGAVEAGPALHASVTEHVDEVLEAYGHLSVVALEKLVQSEPPWLMARARLATDATLQPEIDQASMLDYYKTQLLSDVPDDSAFGA